MRVVDATTLAVDLGPRFGGFRATSQPVDTTMRLVIDSRGRADRRPCGGARRPPASPPPPAPDLPPSFGQPASAIRTIAIDAGHGGDDEGVKSADGAKEKDLTLAVARRVKGAIEARLGIRVLLTRDDDRSVPVDDRTAVANNNKADLFISLHAQRARCGTATSGASIFVAAFDRDAAQAAAGWRRAAADLRRRIARHRARAVGSGADRHLDQSRRSPTCCSRRSTAACRSSPRPVERAPLRVLESANMPAVLVEIGYLTNAEQEKMLAGDAISERGRRRRSSTRS